MRTELKAALLLSGLMTFGSGAGVAAKETPDKSVTSAGAITVSGEAPPYVAVALEEGNGIIEAEIAVFISGGWEASVVCDSGIPAKAVGDLEVLAGGTFPGPNVGESVISGESPKDNGKYRQSFEAIGNCQVVFSQVG